MTSEAEAYRLTMWLISAGRSTREASLYVTLAAVRTAGGSSVISQFMESSHSAATRLNEPAASALLQPIRPERR